jgi:KipI family sensor histidine kinase inhibitor
VWRLAPTGDAGLLVVLADVMSADALAQVLALDAALRQAPPAGLQSTVPAYASLLCRFDPAVTDIDNISTRIRELEGKPSGPLVEGQLHEVPVVYDGPDLDRVARQAQISTSEVVALHASLDYLVYCIGFAPGFSYCGELPAALETPRLTSPRARVPAGSVGIAGRQTGIYAVESPGGWNLLGRTDRILFDASRERPCTFAAGDRVRFRPLA